MSSSPKILPRLQQLDALPAVQRPLIRFILAMLLFGFIADVLGSLDQALFSTVVPTAWTEILSGFGSLMIAGLFGAFVMHQYGLLSFGGWLRGPKQWVQCWTVCVFLIFTLFTQQGFHYLVDGFTERPVLMLASLVADLAIGFNEEIWFRGLLLTMLVLAWRQSQRGHIAAILVSSLLFGLWHLTALPSGADPNYVVPQSIYASLLGVMFAVVFLATGSLWPAIITHGIFDFGATYFDAIAMVAGEPAVFEPRPYSVALSEALLQQLPFITLSAVVAALMLIGYMRSSRSKLPSPTP